MSTAVIVNDETYDDLTRCLASLVTHLDKLRRPAGTML